MLTNLPEFTHGRHESGLPKGTTLWTPNWDPPKVGDRVNILAWLEDLNETMPGTVEGYSVENGGDYKYLMIWVRPDKRPNWHKKQNPGRDVCLFAGIELGPM